MNSGPNVVFEKKPKNFCAWKSTLEHMQHTIKITNDTKLFKCNGSGDVQLRLIVQ